ncbi:MAG TPA: hypothetical protein VHE30_07690 [Polyangiaceae bacterium]|nr:hypothetical protein [Polyangiaceae bacterium]
MKTLLLAASLLLFAPPALAEDGSPGYAVAGDSTHEDVAFDDDDLLAAGESPYGDWFKVPPTAKRVMLIRPRTSFVTELLISIGAL